MSEEGSEEDSLGSPFLFLGGNLEGALGFGLAFVLFRGLGFFLPWGFEFFFGWGAGLGTRVGGWGRGGGAPELVAMREGRVQVVNAAQALNLRLQDATTARQMVGQGCEPLHGCNWLQLQVL